ncbi:DNA polymerase III, delta subunit [Granulicatella balaenopterae]|uniref:DNA polymerase III subunit delta n=1 Tax=Granulicatella balaenopterae TaxID=137733 RepID=A0A1H9HSH5_9LACT|nr:DNA polymerase III subunit delta [Granulicatella balaenopterae]SEQ65290.1 DNA polymerase III, delta subunit [Granulicatella balaenopterae]
MVTIDKQLAEIKSGHLAPVYLVQGEEHFLQKKARVFFQEEIVDEADRDLNIGSYNMEDTLLQVALEDAESAPFFGDNRVVFIDKPYFLTTAKNKSKLEHDLEAFTDYLANPLESTVLVIMAPYDSLDSRKKIVKQLKKQAVLIDAKILKEDSVRSVVKEQVIEKGYQIDRKVLDIFLHKVNFSLTRAMQELDKLYLSVGESKEITEMMIHQLIAKSLEENIFELVEAILKKDATKALEIYRDMLLQKEDPIKMNAILVGQFRLLLQVSYLTKQGHHEGEMQKVLGIHPYRIKLASRQAKKYSIKQLEMYYKKLIETELALKTSVGIKNIHFELFILQFCA